MAGSLPEIVTGPLRIGAHEETLSVLLGEPLLFAAHFATISNITTIALPARLHDTLEEVEQRYEAHDAVLELIESLRRQVPMTLSADLARRMAMGMELHRLVRAKSSIYRDICQGTLNNMVRLAKQSKASADDSIAVRLDGLAKLLGFSIEEHRVLSHALAHTIEPALQLFTRIFSDQRWIRAKFWQTLLDLSEEDMRRALSVHGRLAGSGLLTMKDGIPTLSDFWVEQLVKTDAVLDETLLAPLVHRESPEGASRLPAEDVDILEALLRCREPGINVLLHGKPAVDKKGLALRLVHAVGGTPHTLSADVPEADRPAALMVAQQLLAKRPGRHVLVVEKAQAVLTRILPEGFAFFGLVEDEDEVQPLDERLLAENQVPTLWLTNDARRLHRETVARFLFHAEALKGSRADRQALVESMIDALPLAERHKAELVKLEGLSAQQLASAQRLAQATAGKSRKAFARHLLVATVRSQKALARRNKDEARLPVTRYSLDYINAAGRFGPAQILQALKLRPQGSLCLYGLPGTGKTQFAEHLALELGKPILIKHASELFDKYVGESEKRIAEAFDQAEEEGAILLLDEADSFLRDRNRSSHAWEVSTVNELLQRMERFEEIFICTTNLYQQVDVAALRRFTFKLEFLPLNVEQRWAMFVNEAGIDTGKLSESRQSAWEERLALMRDLTPGDFATVKRQCVLLGEALSPEEWLIQLELEVRAKQKPELRDEPLMRVG